MGQKEQVCAYLENANIPYRMVEHVPVYTIEEMENVDFDGDVEIAKNLFLRDTKGKRHFLVMLPGNKSANLKELQQQLNSTPLSFASEERLLKHMGLTKGAVTPFGIMNDRNKAVEVAIDKELLERPLVAVHPNDNAASVILTPQNVVDFVRKEGNELTILTV